MVLFFERKYCRCLTTTMRVAKHKLVPSFCESPQIVLDEAWFLMTGASRTLGATAPLTQELFCPWRKQATRKLARHYVDQLLVGSPH